MTGKTRSGLERLVTADTTAFTNERVGLLTAAITSDGRHAARALLEPAAPGARRFAEAEREPYLLCPRDGGC